MPFRIRIEALMILILVFTIGGTYFVHPVVGIVGFLAYVALLMLRTSRLPGNDP